MRNILFLCTGNSCRSQMAEGFARKYLGNEYEVYSAGTKKHGMNEYAVKVMQEAGVDISSHYSKTIEDLPTLKFDLVVTVCGHAHENCPYLPAEKIVHKGFEDPPAIAKGIEDEERVLQVYRRVRDEIEVFVKNMKFDWGSNGFF